MQTAGAAELSYANHALLMALIDTLHNKGVLSDSDLRGVVDDAIDALKPSRNIISIGNAIDLIEKTIVPKIIKRTKG